MIGAVEKMCGRRCENRTVFRPPLSHRFCLGLRKESVCKFRRVFFDVRNYVAKLMDHATLASVVQRPPSARSNFPPD